MNDAVSIETLTPKDAGLGSVTAVGPIKPTYMTLPSAGFRRSKLTEKQITDSTSVVGDLRSTTGFGIEEPGGWGREQRRIHCGFDAVAQLVRIGGIQSQE